METFIVRYPNAFSSEECKTIIDDINSSNLIPGTVIDGIVNTKMKDSYDLHRNLSDVSTTSAIIGNTLHSCLEDYKKKHPQVTLIQEWEIIDGYNLQKYNPGQGYHISHCENGGGPGLQRVLAWMIYLNTVNDKGGTSFDNYNIQTKAVEGSLLIWPAYWTHFHHGIVSPTETKYIATGWCSYLIPT